MAAHRRHPTAESEIRRWILENDLLEAIVAMPEQLFFNTGIATYVWIFSNRKDRERKGKVQLVDARKIRTQLRRNLGAKRYEISEENAKEIIKLYSEFKENEHCKIFPTIEFAYREITIQRPLRLKFEITDDKIIKLCEILKLSGVKNMNRIMDGKSEKNKEEQKILAVISSFEKNKKYNDRKMFLDAILKFFNKQAIKPSQKILKTIIDVIGERDEKAEICLDEDGKPELDKELKDFERVPWGQDIYKYFEKEVKPYAPDAWIDEAVRDTKDSKIGIVGYEIPLSRYFYKYEAPRKVEDIEEDVKKFESEIVRLMKKL